MYLFVQTLFVLRFKFFVESEWSLTVHLIRENVLVFVYTFSFSCCSYVVDVVYSYLLKSHNSLFLILYIIKNFVVLLQTTLTLFHCVLLEIYSHPSLFARVDSPYCTKSENPRIIDGHPKEFLKYISL